MLGVNQLDFLNYTTAFKGNYRKGPHKLRALLNTPTQGEEFSKNLGGVSVIFGVPLERPDKNSDELLSILTGSKWCDQAVETWLHGFYEFDTLDQLLSDVTLCRELAGDPFMFRAVGASGIAVGKTVARLAGLDPSSYADMTAVAASSTAMAAVIASSTARNALVASSTARAALKASPLAIERKNWDSSWNNNGQTINIRGLLLYTTSGNTDNAFTVLKIDQTVLTSVFVK